MFKTRYSIFAAALLATTGSAVQAAANDHAGKHGKPGGQSASHISASGLAHTNGPNAANPTTGQEQAGAHMSESGKTHSKAGQSHGKNTPPPGDDDNEEESGS